MTTLYSAMEGPTRYKVVVVGAPQVGKTSLVRTWAREPLPHHYIPTMGVSVHPVQMGTEAELVFHDVGGNVFPTKTVEVLSEADAVVLMYDDSRLDETIRVLNEDWIPVITALARPKALLLLVGINVSIHPVTKRVLPTSEKVQTWWQQALDMRRNLKIMITFSSVPNLRLHAEMSRRQLYDFIRVSLGEVLSSS